MSRWNQVLNALCGLTLVALVALVISTVQHPRLAAAAAAADEAGFGFQRVAGTDRFGTAALLALSAFPAGAPAVVVATGFDFPDALTADYLAGRMRAPVLLVAPRLPIPPETTAALSSLRTQQVFLVGLDRAIGDDVESAISHTLSTAPGGLPISVERIGGEDRYDTMNLVDETPPAEGIGTIDGLRTAILVSGDAFPDALAAASLSYARALPIILTDPRQLSVQAAVTMLDLGIGQVLIVGGPLALSPAVEIAVNAIGVRTLARMSGVDRSDTARQLGDYAIAHLGFSATQFDLASGDPATDGADALVLGPLAGQGTHPATVQVLQSADDVGTGPLQFVRDQAGTLADNARNVLAGGSDAAPDGIVGLIGESIRAGVGATVLPALVGASLQTLTTPPAPFGATGNVVRFLFDADVAPDTLQAPDFAAYDAAAPDAPFAATAAIPDPTDPDAVLAYFPGLVGSSLVGNLALATVKPGAVVDASGRTDPDGMAPIPNPVGHQGAVGLTAAPEALTVTHLRRSPQVGQSALDITFDMATVDQARGADRGGFRIVYSDQSGALQELACTAPGGGDAAHSGGGVPGGNGTSVFTILCPDDPSGAGGALVPDQIARIVIVGGTLAAAAATGRVVADFLQVVGSPQEPTLTPDVIGATLLPAAHPGGDDAIVITFDQPVTAASPDGSGGPDKNKFLIVRADGRPSPTALSVVRAPEDTHQVEVTFGADTDAAAVGVQVLAGAVSQLGGGGISNADDALPVTNPATSSRTPGRTAGPVVTTATRLGDVVMISFDQPLAGPAEPTLNALHAYAADGTEMTCSTFGLADEPFPDAAAPATLECDSWATGPTSYGPGVSAVPATSLVLITLDRGMVANLAGQHNPEQAIAVSGS